MRKSRGNCVRAPALLNPGGERSGELRWETVRWSRRFSAAGCFGPPLITRAEGTLMAEQPVSAAARW